MTVDGSLLLIKSNQNHTVLMKECYEIHEDLILYKNTYDTIWLGANISEALRKSTSCSKPTATHDSLASLVENCKHHYTLKPFQCFSN